MLVMMYRSGIVRAGRRKSFAVTRTEYRARFAPVTLAAWQLILPADVDSPCGNGARCVGSGRPMGVSLRSCGTPDPPHPVTPHISSTAMTRPCRRRAATGPPCIVRRYRWSSVHRRRSRLDCQRRGSDHLLLAGELAPVESPDEHGWRAPCLVVSVDPVCCGAR